VRVDDDAPGGRGFRARAAYPRPGHVEPGQGGLHEIFSEVRVAGRQQAGGAQQLDAALGEERRELLVTR
jgi:hypothetical protein